MQRARRGFTLIELLVVVAIIALLMAILLPSLGAARFQTRLTTCMSNLRQIGVGVHLYASENRGAIPRGPADPIPYFPTQGFDQWATNQFWLGEAQRAIGVGGLHPKLLGDARVFFCPSDDTSDPVQELAKIERDPSQDAFISYLYRQRDETTRDLLDDLGKNELGFPARALALDANSLGDGDLRRTNHDGRRVNIAIVDGHVERKNNPDNVFSIRGPDYYGFPVSIERRLNEIVVAADYAERDDPARTPPLP